MSVLFELPTGRGTGLRFAPGESGDCPYPAGAKRNTPLASIPKKRRPWFFVGGFLLLAGYLLLCHGCHGDEDNELFAASEVISLSQKDRPNSSTSSRIRESLDGCHSSSSP